MDAGEDTEPHDDRFDVAGGIPQPAGNVHGSDDDDEDDDECRVCRGPAEEGRPLYAPCKCSGSIGLIHQDCLMSWLEVTRKEGKCELCKTKFEFKPKYADDAPNKLPAHEVFLGLSSRIVAKWLPLTLRILMVALMWLVVAPLLTVYLYHACMYGPSTIMGRWKSQLVPRDIVSGIVVVVVILTSFLGLMSFADFLRMHWHQQRHRGRDRDDADIFDAAGRNDLLPRQAPHIDPLVFGNGVDENNQDGDDDIDDEAAEEINEILGEHGVRVGVDDGIIEFWQARQQTPPTEVENDRTYYHLDDESEETTNDIDDNVADNDGYVSLFRPNDREQVQIDTVRSESDGDDDGNGADNMEQDGFNINDGALNPFDLLARADPSDTSDDSSSGSDDDDGDDGNDLNNDEIPRNFLNEPVGPINENQNALGGNPPPVGDDAAQDGNGRGNRENDRIGGDRIRGDRIGAFDPLDPLFQDDQMDMEINVALDELLGLRGPVGLLVRNLLWLLAFNATYLAVFAFIPRTIGSITYSGMFNTTFCAKIVDSIPYVASDIPGKTSIRSIIAAVNEESIKQDASFRLSDMTAVALGYFIIATMIVICRWFWFTAQGNRTGQTDDAQNEEVIINAGDNGQPDLDFFQRLDAQDMNGRDALGEIEIAPNVAIGVALDATSATVKVCILLFLKMMLLPFLLGVCLDASTIALLGDDVSQRTNFAGGDLFSFALLHWVAGITFMLLVTVFLLQLREVGHPDVLARVIRPQEPQPDLLGNLMNETVTTHMKRMVLSLGIYTPLLIIYVYTPAKLLFASGLGTSFFHLHFWHPIMPQIQIPIELIMFHLSMLALLERYKNLIGELQHRWLVFICRHLKLTEYLLPREVEKFRLAGARLVFIPNDETEGVANESTGATSAEVVDPFWYRLASDDKGREELIANYIASTNEEPEEHFLQGESKLNGSRVLSRTENYIRLPATNEGPNSSAMDIQLLPTSIGRFRLKRADLGVTDDPPTILFWEEVPGKEIPRPPAGWDDLGVGGAFVQGRWAWGQEEMSVIERSVAHRVPFRTSQGGKFSRGLIWKLILMVTFSWLAISATASGLLIAPLAIGRSLYTLFRVPTKYVHDPLAFYIGSCLLFPLISLVVNTYSSSLGASTMRHEIGRWTSSFHLPPTPKLLVLSKSCILWSLVTPLTLGVSYELLFVKNSSWFRGDEPVFGFVSFLLCWIVGLVFLNTWCFLAYYEVFTVSFWAAIGNGILEPPIDVADGAPRQAEGENQDRGRVGDNNNRREQEAINGNHVWQGKNGRVAQFFSRWYRVLTEWDWELVDRSIFLDEFTLPISKQIIGTLLGSVVLYLLWMTAAEAIMIFENDLVKVPFFGYLDRGFFRLLTLRALIISTVLINICSAFRSPLRRWFEAAHKAARDDRYLVGEILMNYPGRSPT